MADLAALIERLEALTGPDREVDADIWCELFAPDAVAIDPGVQFPRYTASTASIARCIALLRAKGGDNG